jgi:PAT family beta-lactamase induction signal transducer AmpG
MPALSESRTLRYLAFSLLYFAQGVPWGFIAVGYVVFLTDQGLDNTAIGAAIGLAYVPWSFKLLWGPLLDRVSTRWGRRRPFIVVAELFMGLTIASLLFVDPTSQLDLVGWILFAHNTAASLQDVAVDALAVDLLQEDERGRANSFMWAGKSLGVALGGGAGTVLAARMGWPALFMVLAVVVWLVMLVPLLIRERPAGEVVAQTESTRFGLSTLWRSFSFPTPWLGVLVALGTPIGYALVGTVFTRTLRADLGLSEDAIGLLTGAIDPLWRADRRLPGRSYRRPQGDGPRDGLRRRLLALVRARAGVAQGPAAGARGLRDRP